MIFRKRYSARDLLVVAVISISVVAVDYLVLPRESLGLRAGVRSFVFAFLVALIAAFREERGRK